MIRTVGSYGQTSFEFAAVLGAVLLLTAIIFTDASNEAVSSLVLSGVKKAAVFRAGELVLANASCASTSLVSLRVSQDTVLLSFSGCKPQASLIADGAEQAACGTPPNRNDYVDCGGVAFRIIVQ